MELNYKGYFFSLDQKKIDFNEVLQKVRNVQNQIKPYHKIVINLELESDFTAAFLATTSLNKEMIVLPNNQEGTLKKFKSEYDFIVSNVDSDNSLGEISLDLNSKITMFTSGSQGEPQKIVKDLNSLIKECHELSKCFSSEVKNQVVIATVSHKHIYGILFRVLWPLFSDRLISDFPVLYPEHLNKSSKIGDDICLISSPAFLKRLRSEDVDELTRKKVKTIFSSGGNLDFKVAEKIRRIFNVWPIEIYGSTETGGIAYRKQIDNNSRWKLFDCVEIETDSRNCLVVDSPYIPEGRFTTNDLISDVVSRTFLFKGRLDRTYKIEEKRISLDEMEKRILELDNVNDVYCTVLEINTRQVIGCVIAEGETWKGEGKLLKVKKMKEYLLKYYESILTPKNFRFVDELPYNEQSKLQKNVILGFFNED